MGFEYGYSVANRKALVMWEAQYGDFANGAQSIMDEFISSGEAKWGQRSRVVILLPHGYEGGGPDHSTGRIERVLQMCAEDNMTVANCTTPANYFHLLRRQALGHTHRPLIVFTPKSLLRTKAATSAVEDFTSGRFAPVLDASGVDPAGVRRVLFCSGKVYYDLVAARAEHGDTRTAIIRFEQLYPLPGDSLRAALAPYPNVNEYTWVQEEPANQGGWPFLALNLPAQLPVNLPLRLASRRAAASPAAGSGKVHDAEQKALISQVFG
jgi:2-oxoglutarate dehydrogenase complex dehydrogenase (E1) component-like enzyme